MAVIIIIITFIILAIVTYYLEGLNLSNRPCDKCKKVKKGVRERTAYLKRMGVPTIQKTTATFYLCDECAKKQRYIIIEEVPDDPFDD